MSINDTFFQNPQMFKSDDWPRIISHRRSSSESATLELFVQKEVSWFEGHFPGTPVLAGVVQTHWAAEFGRDLFGLEGSGIQLDNIKFSEVVLPETRCLLQLDFQPTSSQIAFKYHYEDHLYSSGRIKFV